MENLSLESSRHMFGHTLDRTENILKTSEIRIQDLDAQVRGLKLVGEINISHSIERIFLCRKMKNSNTKMKNYENVLLQRMSLNKIPILFKSFLI